MSREKTESSDRIPRAFQPEEKRLARLNRPEGLMAAGRLPEVHLVDGALPRQELVPVEVGIGDPAMHNADRITWVSSGYPCRAYSAL